MQHKNIAFALLIALCGASYSQQASEAECKRMVDCNLAAIERMAVREGADQRLKALDVEEIRRVQERLGSCAAYRELNRRLLD